MTIQSYNLVGKELTPIDLDKKYLEQTKSPAGISSSQSLFIKPRSSFPYQNPWRGPGIDSQNIQTKGTGRQAWFN